MRNTNIGEPVTATDDNGDTLIYSLSGDDSDEFTIGEFSGQIRTYAPLDFEDKNRYLVTVKVNDGRGGEDSIRVTINVDDVNERPDMAGPQSPSYAENSTGAVATYTAEDPEEDPISWTVRGSDGSDFTISSRGVLKFVSPPDYENPTDSDPYNEYKVTIRARDDSSNASDLNVTVTVTDVNERPFVDSPIADQTMNAGVSRIFSLQGRFSDPDGDTLNYSVSSSNTAVATASVSGDDLTIAAKTAGSTTITVTAADRASGHADRLTVSDSFTVTVDPIAPAKVTRLTGTPGSVRGTIDLDWDPADRADYYEVAQWRQRVFQSDHWVVLDSTEVTIDTANSSAVVKGLTGGESYKHRVRGIKGTGSSRVEGEWSDEVETTLTLPAKVTGLSGAPGANHAEIILDWDAATAATGYEVRQRKPGLFSLLDDWIVLPADRFLVSIDSINTSAVVSNLDPDETYRYQVRGTNVHGDGEWSDATPEIAVRPDAPKGLMTDDLVGGRGVKLKWGPAVGAVGYEVEYSHSTSSEQVDASGDSIDFFGLTPGITYSFRVRAWNRDGGSRLNSDWSATIDNLAPMPTSLGHQADHTVKYAVGTIGNSVIEDAIARAASAWNSKMGILRKGLVICTGSGCNNPDGYTATIKAVDNNNDATATDPYNHDEGCGGARACVKYYVLPGNHLEIFSVIFEDPPWHAEEDPPKSGTWVHTEYEWTKDKTKNGRKVPGSGSPGVFYVYVDRVMLHELGHTLGLPEFYNDDATGLKDKLGVMNKSFGILDEDIKQLRAIYLLHNPH